MGRRKGSLNKKTIEKMKLLGLLQDQSLEQPKNLSPNFSVKSDPNFEFSAQGCVYTAKTEKPEFGAVNGFYDRVLDKVEGVVVPPSENENGEVSKSNFNSQSVNQSDIQFNTQSKNQEIISDINKKQKNKSEFHCERCNQKIYCEPRKIDINMISGMAQYHRESNRYVKLCDNCCKELNSLIDEWLINPEKGGNENLKKYI